MRKSTILFTCIGLLAIAGFIAIILVKTAPKAEKKQRQKTAALVDTVPLNSTNEAVVLALTGTVMPAETVMLRTRVGGEVVSMSPEFIEGGLLGKGSELLKIDPVDYELALADAQSRLVKAQFDYKLELGRQDVARREWELLKTDNASELEKELALRIPHLAASKAALEAAESSLEKARLNLARTDILAPFNAVVLSRNVNAGSQASVQDVLARLAGTDAYWIKASIPVDRLGWVEVPGSPVNVISPSGTVREGRVIKLLGDLEEKGRMARLLVEVRDPLCLKPENSDAKALLLGEYVRAEITGRMLNNVCHIPRSALHEGHTVWIVKDGKLDIRTVEVAWRGTDHALIRGTIADGEALIISDLTAPIHGMDISTGEKKTDDSRGDAKAQRSQKNK